MKTFTGFFVIVTLAAGQDDAAVRLRSADEAMRQAQNELEQVDRRLGSADQALQNAQRDLARNLGRIDDAFGLKNLTLNAELGLAAGGPRGAPFPKAVTLGAQLAYEVARGIGDQIGYQLKRGGGDGSYDAGARALDERRYDDAIARFTAVIDAKSPRADGALYWKAYALNRAGRRDDALTALTALRRDYPQSHWLNDAQALEAEVKQSSGKTVAPGDETNEDLKLMAINSLMNADPERAIPLIENILKGSSGPRVKDRAMFVLTQSPAPRAHQVLTEYAKGAGNPDQQIRAVRYIGMSGTVEAQQQLTAVYGASADAGVKKEVIRALMISKGKDPLLLIARSEKDAALRLEAIRQLGAMRATDQLVQLFASETAPENKVEIVRSLFIAGASDKLLEIAKAEKEPRVRIEAIRSLANSRSATPETMAQLYASESDVKTKKEIINGLHMHGDAKPLIDLARKESDPVMKKYIVERLSTMRGKEATDYMMELLK